MLTQKSLQSYGIFLERPKKTVFFSAKVFFVICFCHLFVRFFHLFLGFVVCFYFTPIGH